MGKKYSLKRKHTMSTLAIILIVLAFLVVMNVGYSLWSSKLNISGTVTLDFDPPAIEASVIPNADNRYVNVSGLTNDSGTELFDLVSEEYKKNELVTTLRVNKNSLSDWISSDLMVNFSLKNTSENGYVYTDGKVSQLEVSNPGEALKKVSATVVPATVSANQSSVFNFSASVNRSEVKGSAYYKYAITYKVNGVERYFFYTIKILE